MFLSIRKTPSGPAVFVVTYDGQEIFRKAIDEGERHFQVTLPPHSGRIRTAMIEGAQRTEIVTFRVKYKSLEQCEQLLAQGAELIASGRRMKARSVLIDAMCSLREFHPKTPDLARAYLAYGLWHFCLKKPRHKGIYESAGLPLFEQAISLFRELGDEQSALQAQEAQARCRTAIQSAKTGD